MKNTVNFLSAITMLAIYSCSPEGSDVTQLNPYTVNLEKLLGTDLLSSVDISLNEVDGTALAPYSVLKPNTIYKLVLRTTGADFIRIRKGDGFNATQIPSISSSSPDRTEYLIEITDDVADRIYVSAVPIHKNSPDLLRENPQGFLLP